MNQKINWLRVILITGLSLAFFAVHFIFTFYTAFYTDLALSTSLLVKKGFIESLLAISLFVVISRKTTLQDIKTLLHETKPYMVMAALLLFLGVAAGVLLQSTLGQFAASIFNEMAQEAEKIQSIPKYQQAIFLFGNNTRAATFSGILAFIPLIGFFLPPLTMVINGIVIGLAPHIVQMSWFHFIIAILPHGVLEIPALVLASGVGLRFAVSSLKACIGFIFPPAGASGREVFLREIGPGWQSVKLFTVVIPLLVGAAIIEAYVSPWVMGLFGIVP